MLIVKTLIVTPFQQNARLLVDQESKNCLLIDPGGEADRILDVITTEKLIVSGIFLTHAHIDHGGGVKAVLAGLSENNSPADRVSLISCGEEERVFRERLSDQAIMFGLSSAEYENVPEPDRIVVDGDTVACGPYSAQVLFTPGHSPGHMALYFDSLHYAITFLGNSGEVLHEGTGESPLLIAGDTLFSGSIGRTDLPGGDHQTLLTSIKDKILTLPDTTRVLSGHGPDTSVGVERDSNPFLS